MNKKTVKVRVAVAVDKGGSWKAFGFGDNDGWGITDSMFEVLEDITDTHICYWLTAELEMPREKEIEVEVEKA